jgi:hypothetical protein
VSADQPEAGTGRSWAVYAAERTLRLVTAAVLLGILLLLVALVGQGAARARTLGTGAAPDPAAPRPGMPRFGDRPADGVEEARQQARLLLAYLRVQPDPAATVARAGPSRHAAGVPVSPPAGARAPEPSGPQRPGAGGGTVPQLAQALGGQRGLKPEDGPPTRSAPDGPPLPAGRTLVAEATPDGLVLSDAGGTPVPVQAAPRPPRTRQELRERLERRRGEWSREVFEHEKRRRQLEQTPPADDAERQRQQAEWDRRAEELKSAFQRLPRQSPFLNPVPRPPEDVAAELQGRATDLRQRAEALQQRFLAASRRRVTARSTAEIAAAEKELSELLQQSDRLGEEIFDLQIEDYFLKEPETAAPPPPGQRRGPDPSPAPEDQPREGTLPPTELPEEPPRALTTEATDGATDGAVGGAVGGTGSGPDEAGAPLADSSASPDQNLFETGSPEPAAARDPDGTGSRDGDRGPGAFDHAGGGPGDVLTGADLDAADLDAADLDAADLAADHDAVGSGLTADGAVM